MASSSSTSRSSLTKADSPLHSLWNYDVFLSFRGEDTRKTFVGHLYEALDRKGIYVFKDDIKLPRGESIAPELLKAIEESEIAVIVFSKRYGGSSWCLDELVKIMECRKELGQLVLPVFYGVEPSDVRYQTGEFGEAFSKHWSASKVDIWRNALKEAAGIAGINNTAYGCEAQCINEIVATISPKFMQTNSTIEDKLVGLDSRIEKVVSSLKLDSGGVRMMGIWGMGGAGKTTLARAVFNKISSCFDGGICFLENVREICQNNKGILGIVKAQEKILCSILKEKYELDDVYHGKSMICRWLCRKKVLIVLDDVADPSQLEALAGSLGWFGEGSRILITTRDQHLLLAHEVNEILRVTLLNDKEAIELFSRYAFGMRDPTLEFEELSHRVVCYAKGLPLALKILGSYLRSKDVAEWESVLARLPDDPETKILDVLKISYDELKPTEKEIFLDVACFFKGWEIHDAMRILDCRGFYPDIEVKVLIQKSLLTITTDETFEMHDLVQEMGHHIVRGQDPKNQLKHNRVWQFDDIIKIERDDKKVMICDYGPPIIRFLSLHWLSFPGVVGSDLLISFKILNELLPLYQSVVDRFHQNLWHDLTRDENFKHELEQITAILADFFPAFSNSLPQVKEDVREQVKIVINAMFIILGKLSFILPIQEGGNEEQEDSVCLDQSQIGSNLMVYQQLEKQGDGIRTSSEYRSTKSQLKLASIATSSTLTPQMNNSDFMVEQFVVGFDEESLTLLDQLTSESHQKLQIISIVGMPGLGKTTLATKLYNDPLIVYSFDIRVWSCVSPGYVKRDLLLGILSSISPVSAEQIEDSTTSDEKLGELIYRHLKGQRYLLVLDDVWDTQAWNDLRFYFPDDNIRSRILFTARDVDLSLCHVPATYVHRLRLRTEEESWNMLQKKVFLGRKCPFRLEIVGRGIVKKCYGLPLAIVITAGLLRNKWALASWQRVAESLNTYIVSDPNQYMDTLALSYNQLPSHLIPCFLYMGTFPEDYEIPVQKLIWLWVAEGFIHVQSSSGKRMEEIALDYLMDLFRRSLLMVAKRGSDGGIKACRIHDLLRDFCLRKAEELNFPPIVNRFRVVSCKYSTSVTSDNITDQLLNWLFTHSARSVSSISCISGEAGKSLHNNALLIRETCRSLRVLDLESISIPSFPSELTLLVSLRYLALKVMDGNHPSSISNLSNLQILKISSRRKIIIPETIWNIVNLRHLVLKSGENLIEVPRYEEVPRVLDSLLTMSHVYPSLSCQHIFSKTPNLEKLVFCGPLVSRSRELVFPNLSTLGRLRNLKLLNTASQTKAIRSCNPIMFPERLSRLTLSNVGLGWGELWTIAMLLNLEILKLKFHACIGRLWETCDVGFPRLGFLKLEDLDIVEWTASSSHFPKLRHLVLHQCPNLMEVPCGLGEISTLELIEVRLCSEALARSAREIKEEQERNGNDFLQVRATVHRFLNSVSQ